MYVSVDLCPLNSRDPNLWTVKCRPGAEKETVLLLMRKFLTLQDSENVSRGWREGWGKLRGEG